MIRALKMMIRDEALALKLTPDLQQRLFMCSRPQDGRVEEAVCMECTNFGEEYEVSPQQSMRAALRGLFPRNL